MSTATKHTKEKPASSYYEGRYKIELRGKQRIYTHLTKYQAKALHDLTDVLGVTLLEYVDE